MTTGGGGGGGLAFGSRGQKEQARHLQRAQCVRAYLPMQNALHCATLASPLKADEHVMPSGRPNGMGGDGGMALGRPFLPLARAAAIFSAATSTATTAALSRGEGTPGEVVPLAAGAASTLPLAFMLPLLLPAPLALPPPPPLVLLAFVLASLLALIELELPSVVQPEHTMPAEP